MALFFSFCLPSGKAGGLHIPVFHGIYDPHCQGIAVADYTLDALLERSGNPVCGGSEALQLLQRWGIPGDGIDHLTNVGRADIRYYVAFYITISLFQSLTEFTVFHRYSIRL